MIKIKSKNIACYFIYVVIMCLQTKAIAEDISGNALVNIGETHVYTLDNNTLYLGARWEVTKGAKIDSSRVGTEYELQVTWNEAGQGKVEFLAFSGPGTLTVIEQKLVTIALPLPIISINGSTTIGLGESRTLSTSGTYDSYQWLKNGVDISGATGTSVVVNEAGSYRLRATDGGVSSDSDPIVIENLVIGQNHNLVRSISILESGVQSESDFGQVGNTNNIRQSVTYFDGLGRPIQTVLKEESAGSFDLVQHIEYDNFGRQQKNFLPYTLAPTSILGANDGTFKASASIDQITFYDDHFDDATAGNFAFSETEYEKSPLSRIMKSFAPGEAWAKAGDNKPVEYEYLTNNNTDHVFGWIIEKGFLMAYGFYEPGELYKTVTKDENTGSNEGEVIEFKNKQGQVVLKRVKEDASNYLETYYAYDDFGNLSYVLPPMASSSYTNTDLEAPTGYKLVTSDTTLLSSTDQKFAYIPSASITIPTGLTMNNGFESVVHGIVPTQDFLDKWAFQYKYDERQRMIEKKVPGADWVYMVYDDRDRLVLTQDGNQRSANKWSFTKYDDLNRPIITGEKVLGSYSTVKTAVAGISANYNESYASSGLHKYTNVAYPAGIVDADINSVTYYDDYQYVSKSFIDPPSGRFTTEGNKILPVDFTSVKGQVVGTKTRVLGTTTNQYIETVNFYDDRYRLIQTQTKNHKGGDDILTTQYDFAGRVRKTYLEHQASSSAVYTNITQEYSYDHASRLLSVTHQVGTGAVETIVTNTYNELGELETKSLHDDGSNNYAQSIDYAYNMRGWLTKMNDPSVTDPTKYFSMHLRYSDANTDPDPAKDHRTYNGNIGTIDWKNPLESTVNTYDYNYDNANRLKVADFASSTDPTSDHYDVTGIDYDDNGNIEFLNRRGLDANGNPTFMDKLKYEYEGNGNQLTSVGELSGGSPTLGFKDGANQTIEYTYDENGNMKSDANKGITKITYNYLNLPEKVEMSNGDYIEYLYDASGIKLQQIVHESGEPDKTTDYIGGFIYEDDALQFIQHEEGRVALYSGSFEYEYHLKDHLGNTRVTFTTEDKETPYIATMVDGEEDEPHFYNLDETRVNYNNANHSPSGSEVAMLNSANPIGPAIAINVVPGDKVSMETWAYYDETGYGTATFDNTSMIAFIAGAFGGSSGAGGEAGNIFDGVDDGVTNYVNNGTGGNNTMPSAYLNYIIMDENFEAIGGNYQAMTSNAYQSLEKVDFGSQITIDKAGWVFVYVSNESNSTKPVYFDDLKVTVNESKILSKDDYYPFGLSYNSYNKAGMISQKFKYNSFEYQTDLGLNLYDYLARQYDPALGRFTSVDPAADLMRRHSPYNYAFDNPIRFIDPDGMIATDVVEEKDRTAQDKEQSEQDKPKQESQKSSYGPNPFRKDSKIRKLGEAIKEWANGDVAPQGGGDTYEDGTNGEQNPTDAKSENTDVDQEGGDGMMTMLGRGDWKKFGKKAVASIMKKANSLFKDQDVKVSNSNISVEEYKDMNKMHEVSRDSSYLGSTHGGLGRRYKRNIHLKNGFGDKKTKTDFPTHNNPETTK